MKLFTAIAAAAVAQAATLDHEGMIAAASSRMTAAPRQAPAPAPRPAPAPMAAPAPAPMAAPAEMKMAAPKMAAPMKKAPVKKASYGQHKEYAHGYSWNTQYQKPHGWEGEVRVPDYDTSDYAIKKGMYLEPSFEDLEAYYAEAWNNSSLVQKYLGPLIDTWKEPEYGTYGHGKVAGYTKHKYDPSVSDWEKHYSTPRGYEKYDGHVTVYEPKYQNYEPRMIHYDEPEYTPVQPDYHFLDITWTKPEIHYNAPEYNHYEEPEYGYEQPEYGHY